MDFALQIVAIIISIALIILVLLQVKGSGLGDLLGGSGESGGITRTRRGLEQSLFQITIGLAIAFMAVAILAVSVTR